MVVNAEGYAVVHAPEFQYTSVMVHGQEGERLELTFPDEDVPGLIAALTTVNRLITYHQDAVLDSISITEEGF